MLRITQLNEFWKIVRVFVSVCKHRSYNGTSGGIIVYARVRGGVGGVMIPYMNVSNMLICY